MRLGGEPKLVVYDQMYWSSRTEMWNLRKTQRFSDNTLQKKHYKIIVEQSNIVLSILIRCEFPSEYIHNNKNKTSSNFSGRTHQHISFF